MAGRYDPDTKEFNYLDKKFNSESKYYNLATDRFGIMFMPITEKEFRIDASSTDVRQRAHKWRVEGDLFELNY